jgi:DNA-binding GntR family transcriptional regulator
MLLPDQIGGNSTSSTVVDALRSEIIGGHLKPGERLRQDAVASRFGVSQTVVREAFKELIRDCFLASEPRRGVSVATMSAHEAEEITRLRCLVEAEALRCAIPRMTSDQVNAAEGALKKLESAKSVDQIILLNAHFHRALYAAADSPRTMSMVETLRMGFERYLRYTWESTSHRDQSQREHRQLLELCRREKVDEACHLLVQHISSTGALLVKSLASRLPGKPS